MNKNIFDSSNSNIIVTIGIPVFNGEKSIRNALSSVVSQTFSNFQVIISDNASTDQTAGICCEFAEKDRRIKYIRQESNIGAFRNFEFLTKKVKSPYFVWLAADDYWEPGFLAENIAALEADPTAVASISRVAFRNVGIFSRESNGTYTLRNTTLKNLGKYLSRPGDNSRFYSVFRTSVIQESTIGVPPFHAADLLIMSFSLLHGNHIETPNLLMHREDFEKNRYMKQVDYDNKHFLTRLFPAIPMTCLLVQKLGFFKSLLLFIPLLRLNINKHIEYIRLKYGFESYLSFLSLHKK